MTEARSWNHGWVAVAALVLFGAGVALWSFYPGLQAPPESSSAPLYQWRDAQGQWQVTSTPPPEGLPYEVKQYRLDANVLPARQAPE